MPESCDNNDSGEMVDDEVTSSAKTKQQKKEEGSRRAREMAMAKQMISDNDDMKPVIKSGKRANRRSARHGARNQHRHKHFAKWILDNFPHILDECMQNATKVEEEDATIEQTTQMHICDVAGGKGELSARLALCHSLRVVMVDPRPADIESVYVNLVVPKLPKKWQQAIDDKLKESPTFVQELLEQRYSQLVMPFTSPSHLISSTDDKEERFEDPQLDAAVQNASLLIGLHADGATEAIVDAALLYGKPFVVVPCCVFPNLFRERYINVQVDEASDDVSTMSKTGREKQVPVRTHDQFCKYLLAKDPRFVMEVLPFEGRNVAIWWDGK